MTRQKALPADQLRSFCRPEGFQFETTDELKDLSEMLGQNRALEAMSFGIGMPNSGYNLYALGPAGTGKHTAVSSYLHEKVITEPVPSDWIYVNNFKDTTKPNAIRLPNGQGKSLRYDMQQLVEELKTTIPAAFESDEYKARIQQINDNFNQAQDEAFMQLHEESEKKHIHVLQSPGQFTFAPTKDGKTLNAKEFHQLSKEEQEVINQDVEELELVLQDILQNKIPQWRKEQWELTKKLNDEVTLNTVGHVIDALREKYVVQPNVVQYLDEVQLDVIANVDLFFARAETTKSILELNPDVPLRRYKVNLLVDHNSTEGAPVIYEDHPTYSTLVGRIEHTSELGALITDFTLIKSGALHRANGGYLILEARKLLTQPFAYEGLKQALYANEIRIVSLEHMLSLISTVSLEPEPIPLDVKVVLLGERLLYYLLCEYDPDFRELFKVAVDFEDNLDRTKENDALYAQLIATLVRKDKLHAFDKSAVATVIEQSMRIAGDSEKLTAHMGRIADLLRESSFWASQDGREVVQKTDVQRAIDYQIERTDRIRDRMQEAILRDTVMIDTDKAVTGQINGLSVFLLGESAFGVPTRITATTRPGEGKLVDIEREAKLGGPIHSKGVFILSSYLGSRYSQNSPLSLAASITFEQSYGGVEGDSASLAELCALLSSLSKLPINQTLAVTGSVNQHGQVQAIGGVNEKIEGFFDICNQRGLNNKQGVLIPASNVKHLMLRTEVVDAVRDGKFHVYAIENVDQAMELLTDTVAGEADKEGKFPDNSVNGLVHARLQALAEIKAQFGQAKSGKKH